MLEVEVTSKVCTLCKQDKLLSEYWSQAAGKWGVFSRCKACQSARYKNYYSKNATALRTRSVIHYRHRKNAKERNAQQNKKTQSEFEAFLAPYKEKGCVDCGRRFPDCALDFDHREAQDKEVNVSRLKGTRNWKQLVIDEVAKCDLVCANCHRVRTKLRHRIK